MLQRSICERSGLDDLLLSLLSDPFLLGKEWSSYLISLRSFGKMVSLESLLLRILPAA
jgi:hypothetical protein